jgi:hypothetical protein
MGARTLVDSEIEQGARLVRALDEAGVPIDAAFWILADAWGYWFMVVATPIYDECGSHEAYERVLPVLRSLDDVDFVMETISVVGHSDWRLRAIRKRLRNGLPRPNYRLGSFYAEDLEVYDSYVYRLTPSPKHNAKGSHARSGTKSNARSNGAAIKKKAPTTSGS